MGAVLTTLMRGLLGVVATILVVAIVWTLYVKRDAVLAASAPVLDLVRKHPSPAEEGASSHPPAQAGAPTSGSDTAAETK